VQKDADSTKQEDVKPTEGEVTTEEKKEDAAKEEKMRGWTSI
jgi:hypothetical protein